MPKTPRIPLGLKGLNTDIPSHSLPLDFFNAGTNVRSFNGALQGVNSFSANTSISFKTSNSDIFAGVYDAAQFTPAGSEYYNIIALVKDETPLLVFTYSNSVNYFYEDTYTKPFEIRAYTSDSAVTFAVVRSSSDVLLTLNANVTLAKDTKVFRSLSLGTTQTSTNLRYGVTNSNTLRVYNVSGAALVADANYFTDPGRVTLPATVTGITDLASTGVRFNYDTTYGTDMFVFNECLILNSGASKPLYLSSQKTSFAVVDNWPADVSIPHSTGALTEQLVTPKIAQFGGRLVALGLKGLSVATETNTLNNKPLYLPSFDAVHTTRTLIPIPGQAPFPGYSSASGGSGSTSNGIDLSLSPAIGPLKDFSNNTFTFSEERFIIVSSITNNANSAYGNIRIKGTNAAGSNITSDIFYLPAGGKVAISSHKFKTITHLNFAVGGSGDDYGGMGLDFLEIGVSTSPITEGVGIYNELASVIFSSPITTIASLEGIEWTVASTNSTVDDVITESPGPVVDGGQLGDNFIVYKSDCVLSYREITSSPYILGRVIQTDDGILSTRCFADIGNNSHIVLGNHGVYIHNGENQKQNISKNKIQDALYADISASRKGQCFVFRHEQDKETYFCIPTSNWNGEGCNKAYIYAEETDSWYTRDLDNFTNIVTTELGGEVRIFGTKPSDMSLHELSTTAFVSGGDVQFLNNPLETSAINKTVTTAYPMCNGAVKIGLTSTDNIGDSASVTTKDFNPANDYKLSFRETGRYFDMKIEMNSTTNPEVTAMEFDVIPRGKR